MSKSYEQRNHQEWLGYVQPVGLVVSAPAMLAAECQINRNMGPIHQRFMSALPLDESEEPIPEIPDFATFAQNVLDWRSEDLIPFPVDDVPKELQSLEVVLDAYNETLRPTHVVPEFEPEEGQSPWVMLIQEHLPETELDKINEQKERHWQATPQLKFERLLRESDVPFGILTNGKLIRIVYAPKGETSGYITFAVDQMATVAGRPIFAALHMLLEEERVFGMERHKRLPAILANSRKYQNTVSTTLAEQVMAALFELLRGFQAADNQRDGELLKEILANDPQHIYHGLLNVLMRMVFILYAEDRGLISTDEVYTNHYSIAGLFERLRSDAGRYPDTMDDRYGAWAQLLTLFRLIHDGGSHADLSIPPRDGYLFDHNRYPFLEGRYDNYDVAVYSQREQDSPVQVPRVSDGIVYRVLEDLLVLDGERLSYRTLDVEQIGSVYEAIMGFELEVAQGRSIAIKPAKKHGAPATINLEALLEAKAADRPKRLKEWSDQKLAGAALKELKAADSVDGLMNALEKKIDNRVTPNIVPQGAMVFQPSDERRRSGSHYTPRSLTEPIVRTTLEPILKQLYDSTKDLPTVWEPTAKDKRERFTKGEIELRIKASERKVKNWEAARKIGMPHPSQILDLKICDPAMGSGAFLVEVCRQLGDHLIEAWYAHPNAAPSPIGSGAYGLIPPDEDEVLYARRLVAQRCLYGVDKNVMAVDLAKLSLWLVTLAQDHAFTFLDHALRYGDSLVGLTREQIIGFHWDRKKYKTLLNKPIQKRLDRATEARAKILNAREDVPYKDQQQRMAVADDAIGLIRELGDACVSCFFAEPKKKAREEEADRVYGLASSYLESLSQQQIDHASRQSLSQSAARLRDGSKEYPVPAFHWEIEFPEVFSREHGGFDAFVGNPPFLGGARMYAALGPDYRDFVRVKYPNTGGKAVDLITYFLRSAFELIRPSGTFGFLTTNTVAQGDTRAAGLAQIRKLGGTIFTAQNRIKWPGQAAVVVSAIHVSREPCSVLEFCLNGKVVEGINSSLFPSTFEFDPFKLKANKGKSFQGSIVLGMGFTFDDLDKKGIANTLEEMNHLIAKDRRNEDRIFPYIGGDEINSHPSHQHHRFVINFEDYTLEDAKRWPDLVDTLQRKVKPERDKLGGYPIAERRRKFWWQFGTFTPALFRALKPLERFLAHSFTSKYVCVLYTSDAADE